MEAHDVEVVSKKAVAEPEGLGSVMEDELEDLPVPGKQHVP